VLREPLNTEHGAIDAAPDGLADVSIMGHQAGLLAHAVDTVASHLAQSRSGAEPIIDATAAYRLGRVSARYEAAASTPSIFGRVALAQAMRDCAPDLMDVLGSAAALSHGAPGSPDDAAAGYIYRFAPLAGIYGGTLEVFRNMIAQHVLGLGRPSYGTAPTSKS
jgi:alkylation response protein AidB-like acyl-CoA dehydrogenase